MDKLQQLKSRRKVVRNTVTRFEKVLNQFEENGDVEVLKVKFEGFKNILETYSEIQDEISMLGDITEAEEDERIREEDNICKLLIRVKKLLNCDEKKSEVTHQQSLVKLPTTDLPKFNGDYTKWTTFVRTFESLIDKNSSLDTVQKLHYLRSCLGKEPLRIIESLPITPDNYEPAWNLLMERYNNKRLIVQHHIRNIFTLPDAKDKDQLRLLLDKSNVHLEALKAEGVAVDQWGPLLVYIFSQKFDQETNREWESTLTSNDIPTMDKLKNFITRRCRVLDSTNLRQDYFDKATEMTRLQQVNSLNTVLQKAKDKIYCLKCKKSHLLSQCPMLMALPVKERYEEARRLRVCMNCLREGHNRDTCKSSKCKICSGMHHTLLHFNKKETEKIQNTNPTNAHASNKILNILLSTAQILVKDSQGNFHKARALLDVGSQQNFVTEKMVSLLKLPKKKINFEVHGIGGSSVDVSHQVEVEFKKNSRKENYTRKIDCLTITQITEKQPYNTLDVSSLNIPETIILADPEFHISSDVDLLIGAGLFYDLLLDGRLKISEDLTYLQNSVLGWLVGGPYFAVMADNVRKQMCNLGSFNTLEKQMAKHWELENLESPNKLSDADQHCENMFSKTTTRDKDGRFVVRLPFKNIPVKIGSTKEIAMKRLQFLEFKFKKNSKLREEYTKFLNEYIALGHMEEVSETTDHPHPVYLPHHAVIRQTSSTTKVRVVFDGSARSTNGLSLNDTLLPGPNLQSDLFLLLVQFRFYKYALSADIEKMYRQIVVHPDDRDYLRILYRINPQSKLITYRLKTVPYGINCAPFLAMRCIRELAAQAHKENPECSNIIQKNFYMDDLLFGVDSIEKGLKLRDEISYILKCGGFELHKWASNCVELLPPCQNIPDLRVICVDSNLETKTLGIVWNCRKDIFKYQPVEIETFDKITKRGILSVIAKVFDPLGLLCPLLIHGKLIMQEIWSLNTGWDEPIPESIKVKYKKFCNLLSKLNSIEVPRFILHSVSNKLIQIHGFCDASKHTYGAAIYIRAISEEGEISVQLLCAKSRVAPLKVISIPRLELCSALLLAKLYDKIRPSIMKIPIDSQFFWSDSQITLAWIVGDINRWQPFVAHRVNKIQELTNKNEWRYVPTEQNPADLITRGSDLSEPNRIKPWLYGPSYLLEDIEKWPSNTIIDNTDIPESRPSVLIACQHDQNRNEIPDIFYRISKLSILRRTIANCLRFLHNCRHPTDKQNGPFSTDELQSADIVIFKWVQKSSFDQEIHDLQTKKCITFSSNLLPLNVFLDDKGLLRVGGRLRNSKLEFEAKHQILLPKSHPVTKLIIRDTHHKILHGGVQATIAAIRLLYWPLSLKSTTRKVIGSCVRCRRLRPLNYEELMGDLPQERVTPARPFQNTGVDYAGPFLITERGGRGKRAFKSYVAVFVCLCTKAVHLELVHDYTAEAFLNALKRMMSRRGKVTKLYSDNGTNFVGANRELQQLKLMFDAESFQTSVIDPLANEGITWKFTPPNSPYVGGLWEAAVKAFKKHLRAAVGRSLFSIDEMCTLLPQIESFLNSRPLTPLSDDPNDLEVLTPGHFLIGAPLGAPPVPNLISLPDNKLSRWEKVEKARQHFWKRWTEEYLQELQKRSKWIKSNKNPIQEGSLVLLRQENLPPLQWQMARITQLHPGADGIVRTVSLRTKSGETTRAVGRICPLLDMD